MTLQKSGAMTLRAQTSYMVFAFMVAVACPAFNSCKSTTPSQTLASTSGGDLASDHGSKWSWYDTGDNPTTIYSWFGSKDKCCYGMPDDQQFDPMLPGAAPRFLTAKIASFDITQPPDENHVAGPGMYFAEDPISTAGFGDAFVMVNVQPHSKVAFYDDISLESDHSKETASRLLDPQVYAIAYDYGGLVTGRSVVVRNIAFLDPSSAQVFKASYWMAKNAIKNSFGGVDRPGTIFDFDQTFPAAPSADAPISQWITDWLPYLELANEYANPLADSQDETDRLEVTTGDPEEWSDNFAAAELTFDGRASILLGKTASTLYGSDSNYLDELGRFLQTGAPTGGFAGHLQDVDIPFARQIGVFTASDQPASESDFRTLFLARYRSYMKAHGGTFFATIFRMHEESKAHGIAQWQLVNSPNGTTAP